MLLTKFRFIWSSGFGGEDLKKSPNQKQELPVVAMFVNRWGQNEQSLERTFDLFFYIIYLYMLYSTTYIYTGCIMLTDQDEMSNL
jgi:hypothetical protein